MASNQGRIYRYTLQTGQRLTVRVEPLSGDPDLYVWPPDHENGRPPWVSNLSNSVDEVSVEALVAGVYQVEVYGYSAAQYQLTVDITETAVASGRQPAGGIDPTKSEPRTQPLVSVSSVLSARFAPSPSDPAPALDQAVYIPIVRR